MGLSQARAISVSDTHLDVYKRQGILERHAVVQEGDLLHDGYRAAWFQLEIPGDELGRSPGADADEMCIRDRGFIQQCLQLSWLG